MLKRILSSIVAFPLVAAIIVIGGLPLKILLAAISIVGMFELYRAINVKIGVENIISFVFIALYYAVIDDITTDGMIIMMSLYVVFNLLCLVFLFGKKKISACAVNIFGFFYVGFLLSNIYLTRMHNYGEYFVWLIFISAWGCDTFAYFTGTLFGKHKITPVLSPKKTVEGSIGGVAGAVVLALLYGLGVSHFTGVNDEINLIFLFVMVSAFGSIFSQLGDLTASAIKRITGIKDYGKIIPGHGGIMDRFDSVIFTAPIVYAVMCLLMSR